MQVICFFAADWIDALVAFLAIGFASVAMAVPVLWYAGRERA